MSIDIYKKDENNSITIDNWSEIFLFFPNILETGCDELEFWDPNKTGDSKWISNDLVFEHLKQLKNAEKIFEFLNNREL